MDHLAALVFELEVGNIERRDRLEGQRESLVGGCPTPLATQISTRTPQRAEHLRAVESLPLTVFAEIHRRILPCAPEALSAGP